MSIYLVEFNGLDGAGASTTFRYGTEGYTSKASENISDGPPIVPSGYPTNTHYEGLVINPGMFVQGIGGDEQRTFGPATVGGGAIELANNGELDALRDYNFDGQQLSVRRVERGAALHTNVVMFVGTIEQAVIGEQRVTLRVRDSLQTLMRALQATKFAGSNSLPDGLEGVEDDLKGKPKPIWLGYCYNVSPPCVNTSRYIYQLHCGAFADDTVNTISWAISAVRDKYVALTAGALKTLAQFAAGSTNLTISSVNTGTDELTVTGHGYATATSVTVDVTGGTLAAPLLNTATYYVRNISANLITLHPTAADANANTNKIDLTTAGSGTQTVSSNRTAVGAYDWCNDSTGFYIRLGSAPTGPVTVDAVNPYKLWQAGPPLDIYSAMTSATGMFTWVLQYAVATGFGYSGSFSPDPLSQGVFINEEMTVLDAVNLVLGSVGAFVYADASGTLIVARLDLAATTPVYSFVEGDVLAIEQDVPLDNERGQPAWRANLNYRRNWTVMNDADLAGAVTLAARNWLKKDWRTVKSEDSAVLTQYPKALELNRQSLITNATHAATEAQRLRDMYKVRRTLHRVRVHLSLCDGMALGQLINLTYPRFGLDAGANFWLIGLVRNLNDEGGTMEMILWK